MLQTRRSAVETKTDPGAQAPPSLDDPLRQRLAEFADVVIPGGVGMPSASGANVHGKWIDRALGARPDLAEVVHAVIALPGNPAAELERLRAEDSDTFETFAYAMAGSYLMSPRVRKLLGYPGATPKPNPAYPDEAEYYLADGLLDPVLERGPIYRPA
jgi:hypothetical protein